MREILFRGKRLDNGEWVEGGLTKDMVCGEYEIIYQDFDGVFGYEEFYSVNPDTVGQYTGLKDKHEKRIFEGDIVMFPDQSLDYGSGPTEDFKQLVPVVFIKEVGAFGITVKDKSDYLEVGEISFDSLIKRIGIDTSEIEIIGNIHDNPELLEG